MEMLMFFAKSYILVLLLTDGFFHIISKMQMSFSQNGYFVGMKPTMQWEMKMYLHFD